MGKKQPVKPEIKRTPQTIPACDPPHTQGLSDAAVRQRMQAGLSNVQVESPTKSEKQIIRDNCLTYFNLIFIILAACLAVVGAFGDMLFLGIAMITLKLWQLADLALPLIILLAGQVLLMGLFSYFVVYNLMGRNYDAAVLTAGTCGFGMGATPNAMANMQAVTERFVPSVKAYLLVPIVGSLFADFINTLTITFFINLL